MSTRTSTSESVERDVAGRGYYIYAIVTGDTEVVPDTKGVGGRPVDVVRAGDIAALVSEIDVNEPLGRSDDLLAHERLLDAAAVDAECSHCASGR